MYININCLGMYRVLDCRYKHENPCVSPTFKLLLHELSTYFDVDVVHCGLNYYKDGTDYTPYHHDHYWIPKYNNGEEITIGASFGYTRTLSVKHDNTETKFDLEQNNGDIFAFNSTINSKFTHGVPKIKDDKNIVGERFSLIIMGKRRKLTRYNSGSHERK